MNCVKIKGNKELVVVCIVSFQFGVVCNILVVGVGVVLHLLCVMFRAFSPNVPCSTMG